MFDFCFCVNVGKETVQEQNSHSKNRTSGGTYRVPFQQQAGTVVNAPIAFVDENLASSGNFILPLQEPEESFDEESKELRKISRSISKSLIREKRRQDARERYRSLSRSHVTGTEKMATIAKLLVEEVDDVEDLRHASDTVVFRASLVLDLVNKHFPGAGPSDSILEHCIALLDVHSITPENTLYAQSVCPDEINHEKGDITDIFTEYLGEVFHLGGLAGIPFTGKTGFSAFSHHVPDGGNLFILFAPHIGVSRDYKLGKYCREGQALAGAACGASVGALQFCEVDSNAVCMTPEFLSDNHCDYQMHFLTREIYKRKEKIFGRVTENEKMEELTKQVYDIGSNFLEQIVSTDFCHGHGGHQWAGKLILLGGIQINMPQPFQDYFLPLMFQVRQQGQPVIDLLPELESDLCKKFFVSTYALDLTST